MFRRVLKNRSLTAAGLRISLLMMALLSSASCGGNDEYVISATGTIEGSEVSIASKTAGDVKSMPIIEGSVVEAGDTLVVIDQEALNIKLRQARASYDLADAQLQKLLSGARAEDINQAEEALKQAEANLKVAESNYKRIKDLYDKSSVTQQRMDEAEAAYTVAQAQYNSAKNAYNKILNWARPEELRAARAQAEQAKAALDLIKLSISDVHITAPVKGIITQTPVDAGELVSQGSIVAEISRTDTVDLMIYIPEPKLGLVKIGQKASISIDTYPDRKFEGRVVYITPRAEFTPKNIQTKEDRVKLVFGVKIKIPNPDDILKPGMPADAEIHAGQSDD